MEPGVAAVLALTESGEVLDFSHVFVAAPTALELQRLDPTLKTFEPLEGRYQMLVGDELILSAQLVEDAAPLLGHADLQWTGGEEGLALLQRGESRTRRLVARSPRSVHG